MDTPWHEQDDFWQTFYPTMFAEGHWQTATGDIDNFLALTGAEPGTVAMDLACGPGRHALEMARRGFRVTGVDRTASYLENARQQALQENLS
ncbi:MAG: class I SAM-dependent methyltransferase [Armatimonadetes bacterium]|nr:class I SAM-dependent methyltransferase [Armatimonadota bacterium]